MLRIGDKKAVLVRENKTMCAVDCEKFRLLQNLAEAEYVVAVFMYMRMVGYAADKISILTTYNGQKHLIRDVIQQRCADNRLIGRPHKVPLTSSANQHACV